MSGIAAQSPARPPVSPPDSLLALRVRDVAASLRCPVCQNLSVEDSPSDLAQEMKRVIRERLAAGATPEEVRQYFVSRYGEWVLLKPRATGANLLVWLLPGVALVGGAIIVWRAVRRWTGPRIVAPAPAASVDELRRRARQLREGLRELGTELALARLDPREYDRLRESDEAELARVDAELALRRPDASAPSLPAKPAPRSRTGALAWAGGTVVFVLATGLVLAHSTTPRTPGGSLTGAAAVATDDSAPPAADDARLAELEQRVRRDSTDLPALIDLGHLYLERQQLEPAGLVSLKAIALFPDNPGLAEAYAHLALVLANQGEAATAKQALDKALFLNPRLAEAYLYRGIILFTQAHDYRGAASAWRRYLELVPLGTDTKRVRELLEEARQKQ